MLKDQFLKYNEDFSDCKKWASNIKTWYKLIPNLLTISRPIGIIPANILFFTGNVVPAIILTGMLLLTDLFDGKLARKWNVTSKLGADLDAVGDKFMFLGMSLPLMVSNPLMLCNIIFEGIISLVNVHGRIKGLDTKTIRSGKVKTWFLSLTLLAGYLVTFFNVPSVIFSSLVSLTCVAQGYTLAEYVRNYKRLLKEREISKIIPKDVVVERSQSEQVLEKRLGNEKVLTISSIDPGRYYTGKAKVRKRVQKKNNRYY